MNIQELIEKSKSEQLTTEERMRIIEEIKGELDTLKNANPEAYLRLVTETTGVVRKLNTNLKEILETT